MVVRTTAPWYIEGVQPERLPDLLHARLMVGAEDRAASFPTARGAVLVVADGAGGIGGGAAAAEAVVAAVAAALDIDSAERWAELLARVDTDLRLGETTAVVCAVVGDLVVGASVGDSGALRINHRDGSIDELTQDQRRKPLLGSGRAIPVPFTANLGDATLLLATDGLLKYTAAERIAACVDAPDLEAVPPRLVDLVRLRSGALPDDVGIALARHRAAT